MTLFQESVNESSFAVVDVSDDGDISDFGFHMFQKLFA
jgi:hypothetical protein